MDFNIRFYITLSERGGLIRKTKLHVPMQELELIVEGGPVLMREEPRGIIAGFYRLHRGYGDVYMHSTYMCNCL